ncbi:hypothetical protein QTP86_002207 [Hemibagrus guttatus]|nr:hypothetical protein QTP86_002207 [Hemibagrus guttatus]
MRKSGVAEKYVRVVQDMYERSRTVVRCAVGQTEEFKVEVGLHQGSALSPFLFAIVMDQLSEEVRQESPWTMVFADDIVMCREQVEENLERWRFALERRGMKVSRSKTEYMCVNEREGSGTVRLQGEEVKKVQEFKYLGSTVQSNGECAKEVKKRVQAGWNGWRKVSGVLCDRKISARIKGKVYRSEREVAELKMLRFSFGKREEHRVTYKSGGRRTQVDYILCRRGNLKEISDCKVVVRESVARQHRMVVCRKTLMVCKTKRSKIEKKTKWWKLKKEECCEEFRQKLRQALGGQVVLPDDWETTAEVIRETGRKVLGVSSGRRKEDKETWWWNEEVQDSIQRKRLAKKKWDMDRTEENRQEYKELQRRVKREVSKAKQKAYDELYTRLDTREGEKDLYRLARQRDRDGKDVQQVRVIKDRDGRVLTSEESVQRRWKEYFEELMNEENEREKRVEGVNSVEQKVDKIRKDEVRKALKRMKSGKAVGPDDIPVEVWKCLGEAAVEFLANLFNRVLENLEKAYDRVPREELWYCMRKSGVVEKYVRVVQDMYERSRTVVRCAVGQTEEFNVEVGLHQGSALSPFLFAMVMDQLSEELVNSSVKLDLQKKVEKFYDMGWIFNTENNILRFNGNTPSKVFGSYKDKMEFNEKTYSLTLKKLQKNDSGIYEASAIDEQTAIVAIYKLYVLDVNCQNKKNDANSDVNMVYEEIEPMNKAGNKAQSIGMSEGHATADSVYCTVGMPAEARSNVSTVSTANPDSKNQGAERNYESLEFMPQNIFVTVNKAGPGRLAVINGTMNSAVYQKILKENVRPSVCDLKLKRTWVLQQDNDPKHTSKSTSEWLKKNKMKTLEWPSQSPDLNLIEMLWHDLKKVAHARKPSNVAELQQFCKDEWAKIPPQRCNRLIASYRKRLIAVVAAKGGPTSY